MPEYEDEVVRLTEKATRTARNIAFDAAVELCEEIYRTGGCAKCCADAIRTMRDNVDRSLGNDRGLFDAKPPTDRVQ